MSEMATGAAHIPVLIDPIIARCAPIEGHWLDGTFGAGGYTRRLLAEGANTVTAVDRDPLAFEMAQAWADQYKDRLILQEGTFSDLDQYARDLDGVVLDLGVSSMQLDLAERGFSFMQDGPLDMRMSQAGPSAADLVNDASEAELADILFLFGEERASRRIARRIVRERGEAPFESTLQLARVIETCLPRAKPGQAHPATRSFQALRIAVNDEFGELFAGMLAAERALKPGGWLAIVTFHSIEDRMVKRFLVERAGKGGASNRYAPEVAARPAQFELVSRKAIGPTPEELEVNPRSRSAKLRIARRTDAAPEPIEAGRIGMPVVKTGGR